MGAIIKSIVITGASSGIGRSTCKKFIEEGYLVFGSVRKNSDGSKLKQIFGRNFIPLNFNVTDLNAIKKSVIIVKKHIGTNNLTALINNAGIAVLGPLEFLDPIEFKETLETNLMGAFNCTQAFLPLLRSNSNLEETKPGRIINISSALGGKIGYPFYGAYCSSKHALEGMSETLRRELSIHNIFVSIIAPGAIKTPIWDKAKSKSMENEYKSTVYGNAFQKVIIDMKKLGTNGLHPNKVATKIFKAVEAKKPKRRYTFIREFTLNILYLAPASLIDKLITIYLGLKKIS